MIFMIDHKSHRIRIYDKFMKSIGAISCTEPADLENFCNSSEVEESEKSENENLELVIPTRPNMLLPEQNEITAGIKEKPKTTYTTYIMDMAVLWKYSLLAVLTNHKNL